MIPTRTLILFALVEMLMRRLLLFLLLMLLGSVTYSQNRKMVQRSWIRHSVENLSGRPVEPDTLYTRYDFGQSFVNISFYPAWNTHRQPWSIKEDNITIGFDTYKIEEVSDTSLTIALAGFRRVKFLLEEYLGNQEHHLVLLGDFNGKPLFKANNFISPRFTGENDFHDLITKNVSGYNIKKANYFLATFIVTESGKVENVKVIKGITTGFDDEIGKQIIKTSKKWRPAYFQGKPIATEMSFDIKYLDSLVP
jgi:hypothetical protein